MRFIFYMLFALFSTMASANITLEYARTFELSDDMIYKLEEVDKELYCLAEATYFESRGTSFRTMIGVNEVVKNRRKHDSFPDTYCGVINQTETVKGKRVCQFSWVCRNRKVKNLLLGKNKNNLEEWEKSIRAAFFVKNSNNNIVVQDSLFFASSYVNSNKISPNLRAEAQHGGLTFYAKGRR